MSKKKTTEEFIKEAIQKYSDNFDYSDTEYKGNKVNVTIKCNTCKHVFEQRPNNHLRRPDCTNCKKLKKEQEKIENKKVKIVEDPTESFIRKAKEKRGDEFDYSEAIYVNAKTKVKLKCKEGHSFYQSPSNHLHGFGCITCARVVQGDSKRKNLDHFLKKFKEKHGDTYCYKDTVYVESHKKIKIRCKHHGLFLQTPNNHAAGKGCEKCARINNSFVREDYVKMAKGRDTILYIIRCFREGEEFYKIGKTYQTIEQRYKKSDMPYQYQILDTFISDASTIHIKEVELHKKYGMYSHSPKILFGGYTECYSMDLPLINVLDK